MTIACMALRLAGLAAAAALLSGCLATTVAGAVVGAVIPGGRKDDKSGG